MTKLYKRDADGRLRYHEAWASGQEVVEHWGLVGTRGETRNHPTGSARSVSSRVAKVLEAARAEGFEELDEDDVRTVLIEYAIESMGTDADLEKRQAVQARMDEALGWTGLGHCDGGSAGSGTMEVCCLVVDFEIARRVITEDLAGTPFADFTRIYDEDED